MYIYKDDNAHLFLQDMKYWSNDIGDYHHPETGEPVQHLDLPNDLFCAEFNLNLYSRPLPFPCFLAYFRGSPYVVLSIEVTPEIASQLNLSMESAFHILRTFGSSLELSLPYYGVKTVLLERTRNLSPGHELSVCLPANCPVSFFTDVLALLDEFSRRFFDERSF